MSIYNSGLHRGGFSPIPCSEIGARAKAQYDGDGLAILPTAEGAVLRCVFQRLEVTSANRMMILVDDADAVYPVRIDPTFSDENWISMGGVPGADNTVSAAVVDDLGNLYIGGDFTVAGEAIVNRVAKWDGSSWSALGSGMNNAVRALAVSGSDLYAGGHVHGEQR